MRRSNQARTAARLDDLDAAQFDAVVGLVARSFLARGLYAPVSERPDLTPARVKPLWITAGAVRRMADLVKCFGVERIPLTGLAPRAERRDLAQRTAMSGDRWALHVAPSEAGCQAVTTPKPRWLRKLAVLPQDFSPNHSRSSALRERSARAAPAGSAASLQPRP